MTRDQRGLRERWGLCLGIVALYAAVVTGYDMAAILGGVGILLAGAVVEAGETVAAAIRAADRHDTDGAPLPPYRDERVPRPLYGSPTGGAL